MHSSEQLQIWELIMEASLLVQGVMLLLVLASVVSWMVIFRKRQMLARAQSRATDFEDKFWSGADLGQLYDKVAGNTAGREGLESIFEAGFREFSRAREDRQVNADAVTSSAQRAMRVALTRELDRLENQLSFLATVGSVSPYIGLFGTVWGIMGSFQALSMAQQATLTTVAPWIAEALIATAMGLFAAIPAVIFYNRLSAESSRLLGKYEDFAEEFHSILHRNLQGRAEPGAA